MNLIGYSPHLCGVLLFMLGLEYIFFERKRKVRAMGIILRLSLLVVVAMVIVHFVIIYYNGQFKRNPIILPEPNGQVWET